MIAGVGGAVAVERRRRAEHDADRDRQEQSGERQDRGDGEAGPDHLDDRHAREAERHAERAVGDVAEIAEELHDQRPVEAVVGAQPRLQHRVAGVVAEQRGDRVARHELRGDEGQHDGEEQDGQKPDQRRVA